MNWRRGLLRAWLCFAVPWIGWHGWNLYDATHSQNTQQFWVNAQLQSLHEAHRQLEAAETPAAKRNASEQVEDLTRRFKESVAWRDEAAERARSSALLIWAAPAALLGLFGMGAWVWRGLRRP